MAILGDSKVWIYKTKRGNLKLEKKKITVFQGWVKNSLQVDWEIILKMEARRAAKNPW